MDASQINRKIGSRTQGRKRWALGATAALAMLIAGGRTFADDPVTMAPPVQSGDVDTDSASYSSDGASYTSDGTAADASADSVFNWQEVPQDQQVPIRRAVFDRGGYQLYDNAGETIVVPFTDQNLYVMKFAVSPDGSTYFVNTGDAPVLYIPRGGYLDNAAVPSARWYPFSDNFHPEQPVFVGIAPSWDDYCTMGWYPFMHCYGGYWGEHSFLTGGLFLPCIGLTFIIGGHHFDGWAPYHHYYYDHPAPYHVTIVNRNIYRFGGHPDWGHRTFGGGHAAWGGRGDHNGRPFPNGGGGRVFNGTGHPYYAHRTFPGGRDYDGIRPTEPGSHRFTGGDHSLQGGRPDWQNHPAGGGRDSQPGTSHRTFEGGGHRSDDGGRTFDGGSSHTFPRPTDGDGRANGPRTFEGGGRNGDGGNRTFSGGGNSASYHGGTRSFPSTIDAQHPYGAGVPARSFRNDGAAHSTAPREESHQSSGHQSSGHQDSGRQDSGHQDSGRQNNGRQDGGRQGRN